MKTLFLLIPILIACSTTPTGRSQLTLMSSGQMNSMGAQSFEDLKKKMKIDRSSKNNQVVTCISHKLLKAIGESPSKWEIVVFEENTPNAFALPGNKIGVHTGMMKLAQNQHQLAAVIGHEIAHVKASHGNERVSQNMVVQGGLLAASIYYGSSSKKNNLILAGLGLGAQVGVLLPFSRSHETEADRLGLRYMAKAGFDPRQASKLWEVMKSKSGGAPPEFLSTHPSNDSRIKDLRQYAQKFPGQNYGYPCPRI